MKSFAALIFCGCAQLAAQSFAPPLAGIVANRQGRPQLVFGIAGNLISQALSVNERAVSLAFSGSAGLIKTASELILIDSAGRETNRFPAPGGEAVFGFDPSGRPAVVWFEKTHQLFAISPSGWILLQEPVTAVAALAVDSAGAVQIASRSPALYVPGGVLSSSNSLLTFHHADGSEETVSLPSTVTRFERMGDGWIAVVIAGERFGLRLSHPLRLFSLPEVGR